MSEVKGDSVSVGDKVAIHVDEEKLKELQAAYGGCTATMMGVSWWGVREGVRRGGEVGGGGMMVVVMIM